MVSIKHMGGIGSGGNNGRCAKRTVETTPAIDVRDLRRWDLLKPGPATQLTWACGGSITALALVRFDDDGLVVRSRHDGRDAQERIALVKLPQHYGGYRYTVSCAGCGRRRLALYLVNGRFRCRECHGLNYQSQHETELDRAVRRVRAIRAHLDASDNLFDSSIQRPKGMSRKVFRRLQMAEHAANYQMRRSTLTYSRRLQTAMSRQ